ncbi:MAG: mannose-1-phosphate guanylyltransferase [Treponema sp.]|jgi:mannose-1-phosphate guanylyltransferase/mannose-1-phosphate guanylyltransferase/mannose-6-phosphate isomerase|nr:mannose-1-phosphate guanylyltransferase [Treponema sp.]
MFDSCLIMAGGSGTRLWPASSSRRPKQFLPAAQDQTRSFFSLAVERALAVTGADGRVIIIAGKSHIPLVLESCASLNAAEKKRMVLIPEPLAKSTAPAVACAVSYAEKTTPRAGGPGRTMLVLTSDHIIRPVERFRKCAALAAEFARKEKLAVFGIPPRGPETGYGYIETGKNIAKGAYDVAAFREKPGKKTAERFAASKRFFWNSGMFAFDTRFMTGEFRRLAVEVIRPFEKLKAPGVASYTKKKGVTIVSEWAGLESAYRRTKSISFDYAIAEQCSQTVMVKANFEWIDIGSWEEYAKLLGTPGSAKNGSGPEIYCSPPDSDSCYVDSDIPVALAGIKDLIVVIRTGKDGSPPAALIAKKGETQRVKDIVEQIKKAGRTGIL